MPEISRFYGIVIKMFFKPKEHEPSHIHALYGEHIGIFDLRTMKMTESWFYHMAIPPISYTSLFRFGASGRGRISIFHPQPGKCKISGNRTHPPPTELDDPGPGCGILPDGDVCGRCEQIGRAHV